MTTLQQHPRSAYQFLPGIAPYSCGVIANVGYEICRVVLRRPASWPDGFRQIDSFLRAQGRHRTDLCAMELRSPKPFSMEGFIQFNRGYCAVLEQWGVFVDGLNPIARTNVCPLDLGAEEPVLHAFSFVRPQTLAQPRTFIVAGAGELLEGTLVPQGIVRRGETSESALAEKARYVCTVMQDRLTGLGATWTDVTALNAYTIHSLTPLFQSILLPQLPAAHRCGVQWHYTRPPVLDIEYEMDLHGLVTQWCLV
jgi:hypothetical protein